jgi:hypothetical protein
MNLYKELNEFYISKGMSVIPDKYKSKMPAIRGWSDYCKRLPTPEEVRQWGDNFDATNIALCLGEASGIIAVDVDTNDADILELIRENLDPSPYEKVGTKGFTRFYRWTPNHTTAIFKHNGEVLFELLSTGKKSTLPPSIHPSGSAYKWRDAGLIDLTNVSDLPLLSPYNLTRINDLIRSKFPSNEVVNEKFGSFETNGRNDALVKLCGKLISEKKSADEVIKELVEYDKTKHEVPYFSDPEEQRHVDPFTNALKMYSYQLDRINAIHHAKNEEYETVNLASAVNAEYVEAVESGKSQRVESEKKLSETALLTAPTVIRTMVANILDNSWIKQPDLAFSATLALWSTLLGRKVVFGNLAPNLYILNVSPSGSGKDAPQQMVKQYLIDIGADSLLGAGDYVSDASLMDSLGTKPVRLDIMDEMGGILRTFTKGGADFNRKMADILCELYTSSNSKYLGRATAEGIKGGCYRPNVSILGSTTPTGFSEGVSRSAIEKGLIGRFLLFFGEGDKPAQRLKEFPPLPKEVREALITWKNYEPEINYDISIGGIEQKVTNVLADDSANARLDAIFTEFDDLRREADSTDPMLPIISRLYQQAVKVALISACARCADKKLVMSGNDVEFGYQTVMYFYRRMRYAVRDLIHDNQVSRLYAEVLNAIPYGDTITKSKLSQTLRGIPKRKRDEVLGELVENGEVLMDSEIDNKSKRRNITYRRIK